MKFDHSFALERHDGSTYLFVSGTYLVRLDFLKESVRVSFFEKDRYIFPTFSVCPDGRMPEEGRDKLSLDGLELIVPEFEEREDRFLFRFGNRSIEILRLNFEMSFFEDGKLLFKDREYLAHNIEGEFGKGSYHFLSREEDEKIFGLGDKTGDIDKNKRSFALSTGDAMGFDARSSDPLYKHIPFYMCANSVGSYGIYYDTYSQGAFDFGREINNYYAPFKSFHCEEESLIYYVFFGELEGILQRFSRLCGPAFLPPKWTLSYCGSTMEYTDADNADERLREFVSRCKEYGIACGGFYLSSGYTQIGDKRCVFHWNLDKVPDPEGLARYFKRNGIEFLPNVKPCFLTVHPMYEEIAKRGYFLKGKDGKPALFPFWSGRGSYLDFTNPEAAAFWTACVKESLVDKGYLNTWNDNNEYDIRDDETMAYGFGHPVQAKLIRPLFSYLMTRASLKAQREDKRKNAVSRSGIVGTTRIASTWTGDNRTSFEDFRYNHKMAMTMSLSGIYNFGQDIGGFAGPCPEKELFLRWIQYGIFTPRFVLHSWNSDGPATMPWLYPEEKETVQRLFALRESFVPYLYQQLYRSSKDALPVIYPIFLKYPGYDIESDAYFFGNDIIALPIFDKGRDETRILLPENEGGWYFHGKRVEGEVHARCTIHDEPLYFVRAGSILPEKEGFAIYLGKGEIDAEFLDDDGVSPLEKENVKTIHIHVEEKENGIDALVESTRPMTFRLIGSSKPLNVIYR